MAIYTIADLRAAVPARMKSLSDEELISDYSKRLDEPYEVTAQALGVKPRGTLSQIGTSLVKGVDVGLRGMVGKAMEYGAGKLAPGMEEISAAATSGLPERRAPMQQPGEFQAGLEETGRGLQQRALEREKTYLPADFRKKNWLQQGMIEGAESIPSTAATLGAALINPVAGAGLAYGLYGYSSAKDTYDKLIKEGASEEDARAAASKVELLQGGGEAALNALGAKMFKPFGRAFGAGAATTTGAVAQQLADTGIVKPFAKAYLTSLIAEPTTEVIQDVGTSMIEQAYGGKKEDLLDIASQSARAAVGMTVLLGPFGLGAHAMRARGAQEIKAALSDDPNVAPERRAEILQSVASEARRAGIGTKDITSWVDSQVAMADRQNTALELMEDAIRGNYAKQFEAAFTAPSGVKVSELGPDNKPVTRELSMGELLQQQAEQNNAEAEKDLLARENRSPIQVLADIRAAANDPMSASVWRFPVSTGVEGGQRGLFAGGPESLTAPRPALDMLGGGRLAALEGSAPLGAGQLAAMRGPIDETAPRPALGLGGLQQTAAGGVPTLTSAGLPVSQVGQADIERLRAAATQPNAPGPSLAQPANLPGLFRAQPSEITPSAAVPAASLTAPFMAPPGGVTTALPSSAPAAPGAFSTAPAAPVAPAAVVPTTKPTKAVKVVKPVKVAKVEKPVKVVAPKKTVIARSIEQALEEELDIADRAADSSRAAAIMAEVNKENLGAEVQGAKQIKAPGRMSLSQRSLTGIRDAIFRKSGKVAKAFGNKEQKVVDAVSSFTNSYDAYLNYSSNLAREVKSGTKAKAEERVTKLEDLAKDVQNSLFNLGKSLDNNAKNVEAVVRVVKDTVQQKLAKPGKTKKETLEAMTSLDTVLSSGWAAAKRESFMSELPDLADVSGQVIRPSTELQQKAGGKLVSALEDAAKNGFGNPKGTAAKVDGLKGVLQYLRFNTTPMGRVLARALRDALDQSENPAKISFVDKSGSRYDPKTNTVYINRNEQSSEVVLHEAFHAALQWYVYQNPNAPAVKQLQLSLNRALEAKGLEGKALEVQNILQDLVNKERGLDAVLELISYNATLNEFRRAMQQLKTGDAPKSFLESIKSVWAMYKAIVRRMLGVGDNVASDVLSASMQLLEESTKATMPKSLTGKALNVATTAFRRWFGDSKVVDDQGQPLIVYHGTIGDFTEFSKEKLGASTMVESAKKGFFFGGKPEVAERFSRIANRLREGVSLDEAYDNFSKYLESKREVVRQAEASEDKQKIADAQRELKDAEEAFASFSNMNQSIMPVYLSLQNPLVVDQQGKSFRDEPYASIIDRAVKGGYDGVIIKNTYDGQSAPTFFDRAVAKLRGKGVPTDTIYIAFEPTQIKSQFNRGTFDSGSANILEAKVQSGTAMPESPQVAAAGPNLQMSAQQFSNYAKTKIPRFTLTQTLFNEMGWADWMSQADKKLLAPVNKFIQKETPKLAQAVSFVNSHYNLPTRAREMLVGMKDSRRGGTAVSEQLGQYIANLPVDQSKALLSYMNDRLDYLRGQKTEPAFTGSDTFMKGLADQAIDNWWKYATEGGMSAKDRTVFAGNKVGNRWVGGLKFSEGFVFPESVSQLASSSFGSRNMRELKSRRVKDEISSDNIRFRNTVDGDPILTDKFVGIYNDTPALRAKLIAGESLANVMPDEFISAELFTQATPLDDNGQAMLHDPAFTWDLQTKGKNGFRFSAHYDAREAYSAKKALDVANAFQNTMTLLANSYSSNTFAKGLYDYGTMEVDGETVRDGSALVFDDIDQLNAAMNGTGEGAKFKPETDSSKWTYEIKPDKIIRISSDEARSDTAKGMFRNRNQWVLVPKGKDGEVYGALSGKLVSGSVWAAIQDASDRRPWISIPYAQDIMRFFKSAMTKYTPATWGTNVATNITMAIADDIPLSTIPHAARLYLGATLSKDSRTKLGINLTPAEEELMVKVLNSNALLGTFASDEIKRSIYDAMKANLEGEEKNIPSRIMQMAGIEKARIESIEKLAGKAKDKVVAFDNLATEWYAMQDNIFRVASVLNYLGQASDSGMEINENMVYRAGKHARDAFLDYDIDAKAIRMMRQTAFPFISWPYAATKLVGRLAVHKPWKLVNLYLGYAILDAMLSGLAGDDDDEETRMTGPERYREKLLFGLGPNAYVRIPFLGDSDNPVYYHLGKYMFPSSLLDTSPSGFMGLSWWPSAVTPGGPFLNTAIALTVGVDPYDGKPLSDATATNWDKAVDRAKFVQSTMAPNLPFLDIREFDKVADLIGGRSDLPENSLSMAMARYMGLRMYNYNVDAELEKQDSAVKGIEADYKRSISKLRKSMERKDEPDWDEFYEKEEELLKRMDKRIAELRGEKYEEE